MAESRLEDNLELYCGDVKKGKLCWFTELAFALLLFLLFMTYALLSTFYLWQLWDENCQDEKAEFTKNWILAAVLSVCFGYFVLFHVWFVRLFYLGCGLPRTCFCRVSFCGILSGFVALYLPGVVGCILFLSQESPCQSPASSLLIAVLTPPSLLVVSSFFLFFAVALVGLAK